jgi:glycosyltransferase involved in cell wall biosynthesis
VRDSVDVVCLTIWEGLAEAFDAQVLTPLARHAPDVRARVVVCAPAGTAVSPRTRDGLAVSTIPAVPSRAGWQWKDLLLFKRWLRAQYAATDAFVIHARGNRATLLALEMRRWFAHIGVIFDCRGAEPAEFEESLEPAGQFSDPDRHRLRQVELVERRAATAADHILCVSNALAGYLSHRYPEQLPGITVVPCCIDASEFAAAARERETTRRELGLGNRFVVAYTGSLHSYRAAESLRIFKAIRAIRPDALFLGLTLTTDRMQRFCREAGISQADCRVLPINADTIERDLATADIGLLPRRQNVVNRVASPVKCAEYLASGAPVIVSEQLGDYSELVKRSRTGLVLPQSRTGTSILDLALLTEFVTRYSADVDSWRHRCQQIAREQLDWSVYIPRINAVYHNASRGLYLPA